MFGQDRTAGDAIIPALSVWPRSFVLPREAGFRRAKTRRVKFGNNRNGFQRMAMTGMNVELWDIAIRLCSH
jgi:hypothetical protein